MAYDKDIVTNAEVPNKPSQSCAQTQGSAGWWFPGDAGKHGSLTAIRSAKKRRPPGRKVAF